MHDLVALLLRIDTVRLVCNITATSTHVLAELPRRQLRFEHLVNLFQRAALDFW